MDSRFFCVYNPARGVLLSSKVTVADCANQPLMILKLFVGGMALDADSGFWLSPLNAMPAVPRLFPFDLLYLDKDQRVVDTAEIHPGVEFPPYHLDVASALVLPLQTAQSSQTERGDRLIICLENEIEGQVAPVNRPAPEPDAMNPSFADGNFLETVPLNEIELSQSSGGNSLVAAPLLSVAAAVDEPVSVSFSFATGHSDIAKRGNGTGDSLTVFGDQCVEPNAVETARGGLSHVNGHGRGVEDLFANWVDAPSLSAAWVARNAEIEEDGISRFVHSRIDLPPLVPAEPSKIANAANDSQPPANSHSRPAPSQAPADIVKAVPETALKREAMLRLPPVSGPAGTATPQPAQATTCTVAQYGLWQVSMLTPVSPVTDARGTLRERLKVPAISVPASTVAASTNGSLRIELPKVTHQNPTPILHSDAKLLKENGHALAVTPGQDLLPIAFSENPEETVTLAEGNTPKGTAKADLPSGLEPDVNAHEAGAAEQSEPADFYEIAAAENVVQNRAAVQRKSAPLPQSEVSVTLPLPSIRKAEQKGKLKISIQRVDPNGRSVEQRPSLGTRFKRWLNPATPVSSDRRRAHRRYVPGMVAHYYTGGAPKPHEVADISMTGFYLLTEDRWMPDTMIQMTLQKPCAKGERKQSITVLSKIVRRASDGVAAEFVMPESLDPFSRDVQPSQTTDRFSLARFL